MLLEKTLLKTTRRWFIIIFCYNIDGKPRKTAYITELNVYKFPNLMIFKDILNMSYYSHFSYKILTWQVPDHKRRKFSFYFFLLGAWQEW